jgi:hypothetical protein
MGKLVIMNKSNRVKPDLLDIDNKTKKKRGRKKNCEIKKKFYTNTPQDQIRNKSEMRGKNFIAKQNKSFKEFPKMEPKRITYRKKKIVSKAKAAKHNVSVQLLPIRK